MSSDTQQQHEAVEVTCEPAGFKSLSDNEVYYVDVLNTLPGEAAYLAAVLVAAKVIEPDGFRDEADGADDGPLGWFADDREVDAWETTIHATREWIVEAASVLFRDDGPKPAPELAGERLRVAYEARRFDDELNSWPQRYPALAEHWIAQGISPNGINDNDTIDRVAAQCFRAMEWGRFEGWDPSEEAV
jgi:hypothetical protein